MFFERVTTAWSAGSYGFALQRFIDRESAWYTDRNPFCQLASMRVYFKAQSIAVQLGIGLVIGLAVESQIAQAQRLPLPNLPPPPPGAPTVPVNPAPSVPRQVPIDANPNDRVYIAPRVNPGINSVQPVSGRFRVFVDSESPVVLQLVRSIQPDAFIQNLQGRRVIQAGVFSDELKARQQISRFAARDIAAQLTTQSSQPSIGTAETTETQRGYYAIVPGNQNEVREYRDRAIRLGVAQSLVQLRDRPRGLHLAVGPFAERREAEQAVQYLRDRGSLDARLFYDR